MDNKLDKIFENDFIRVPRPLIRKFDLHTAIMLSEIYSEYKYWEARDGLLKGGWFFSTVENILNNTGLSKHQQLTACNKLEEYGIIKVMYHGMPRKRYFKFDTTMFNKLSCDVQLNLSNEAEEEESKSNSFEQVMKKRTFARYSF